MKKIMFNDKYQLTKAVLEGRKTMTRRLVKSDNIVLITTSDGVNHHVDGTCGSYHEYMDKDGKVWLAWSPYKVGEVVAIARPYKDIIARLSSRWNPHSHDWMREEKGWNNKMFVRANLMPHRIRITDIKMERLQDISREDCLLEGIEHDVADGAGLWWWSMDDMKLQNELMRHEWHGKKGCWFWDTPQGAFAALIDKINGKGTWDSNPFAFAYTFKLED